jgi:hypothetical protein
MEKQQEDGKEIKTKKTLYITGFGQFHGVPENPSSILVNDLLSNGVSDLCLGADANVRLRVVEVDVTHCNEYLER